MFVRDGENADEEFENITAELHDIGYELAEGSAFECKNDVTRYLVVKKTSQYSIKWGAFICAPLSDVAISVI